MKIPREYSSSHLFWQRRIQKARLLLMDFPRQHYDNDTWVLAEDFVQKASLRILEKQEPSEPIEHWPKYFDAVLLNIYFEERRQALETYRAGLKKVLGERVNQDDGDIPIEEAVVDSAPRVDELMEMREEEEKLEVTRRVLKKAVDEHLWQIIDEEMQKISTHPAFRFFVERCWLFGDKANAAWESVKDFGPDAARATYYRRFEKLKLAVTKRWAAVEVSGKGAM